MPTFGDGLRIRIINHPRKLVSLLQRVVLVRKIGGLSNRDSNVPAPRNSPFRDGSGPFPLSRATSRLTRKSGSITPPPRVTKVLLVAFHAAGSVESLYFVN